MTSSCHYLLTAHGRAALAGFHLAGPAAFSAIERYFCGRTAIPPRQWPIGVVYFGRWRLADNLIGSENGPHRLEAAEELAEEVVLCRISGDEFEIHCHGGPAVVRWISSSLTAAGCPPVAARAMSPLASHSSSISAPTICQAWHDLPDATTATTAAILLNQARGSLHQELTRICQELQRRDQRAACSRLRALLLRARQGRHLTSPFQVVIAGPVNAGKSSLLNRLLGFRRAITDSEAGTTRDLLTGELICRGYTVVLQDGAGIRAQAASSLEQTGMARVLASAQGADLVLWLVDASRESHRRTLPDWLSQLRHLVVWNKWDLRNSAERCSDEVEISASKISALTGEGIESMWDRVGELLVGDDLPSDGAMPWRETHYQILEDCLRRAEASDLNEACGVLRHLVERHAAGER